MHYFFKKLTLAICVLFLTSCANTHPFKYKYDQQAFQTNKKEILILPFNEKRDSLVAPEKVQAHIIASLTKSFEDQGWTVSMGKDTSSVWEEKFNSLKEGEGLYDPQTGKFKSAKVAKINKEIVKEVLAQEGSNKLVLMPRIIVTPALVESDSAGWHGVSETSSRGWNHFFSRITIINGRVPASSLFVQIYNKDKIIYEHAGGIELIGNINKWSRKIEMLEGSFNDISKVDNALKIVLEPIYPSKK